MNYLKAHLFLIVCGVVALAAVAVYFFYIPGLCDGLKSQLNERLALASKADNLTTKSPNLPGNEGVKGPITLQMVEAKKKILKNLQDQADELNKLASKAGKGSRVDDKGNPLLDGQPCEALLPENKDRVKGDPMAFKDRYLAVYDKWACMLIYGSSSAPMNMDSFSGRPYTTEEITRAWEQRKKEIERDNTRVGGAGVRIDVAGSAARIAQLTGLAEQQRFTRELINRRAMAIKMYATRDVFQIPTWVFSENAPDEKMIFEGFVWAWVQQDIVATIAAMNENSRSVATSPIKRLERLEVGAGAGSGTAASGGVTAGGGAHHNGSTGAGDLFMSMGGGAGMGAAAAGSTLDYSRSMTGRVGSERFDVTHFSIILYLPPDQINPFINELFKQNNGYTILNVKIDSVDPFEAASNGFLYGKVPVARVEILGEAMLFREWTKPLMPPAIRTALGITTETTTPPAN